MQSHLMHESACDKFTPETHGYVSVFTDMHTHLKTTAGA